MKLRFVIGGFIVLTTACFVSCSTKEAAQQKQESPAKEINELPYLSFIDLAGGPTSARTLPGGCILILFNTDCDHCQREATAISNKSDYFKAYQLYFIASDSIHQIQDFSAKYGLSQMSNVHLGRAEYRDVYNNFGAIDTPAIYIYSREKKLVKSFKGETPVEEIIKYL